MDEARHQVGEQPIGEAELVARVDELLRANNVFEARAREAERRLAAYEANHFLQFREMQTFFDLILYIEEQREFSLEAFGPAGRDNGILNHIRKELIEIEGARINLATGDELKEWIDVIQLALDGAWRTGASAEDICFSLVEKLLVNKQRKWPDWRTLKPGEAIEHVRD
jgi:Protein of unknown function (DUF550)